MLSDPGFGRSARTRDGHEPASATSALSSLKRSLAVNLNERDKFRNKEQATREQLLTAEAALANAEKALAAERKEAAALRSQLEDQGIQQARLQEKCQAHTVVSSCLEGTVAKLGKEVKDGDKLQQEMATWLKDESEARQQLTASAKSLTARLQLMDTSLAEAERTVSDLQKTREVLECKLTEIERAQVASAATHTGELEKLEHRVQVALAAKDELYRDLVAVQQAKGELKEELGLERVAMEGVKNNLTSVKAEHIKGKDQLHQLTDEHTQLKGAHEVVCTRVKELEESCSALQGEKSDLKTALREAESDHTKLKTEHEERILAITDELKHSEEGRSALHTELEEAREQYTKLMHAKDAAAAEFETEAAKSHTAATALHAEIVLLQERVQSLQKETAEVSQGTARTAEEKLAVEGQLQDALLQIAASESELEAAKEAASELEVSLAVQTMTKNVADADLHSQIAELNDKLEEGVQALAKAEASIQTLTDDTEQQGVKRWELETRISALSDQIAQERASNKAALVDQRRCMAADNEKALADVETQAAQHVKTVQQSTVKLQAEVAEKITEISNLQSELGELQKSLTASRDELITAKQEQTAEIARLEATHAARISERNDSEAKVKTLLDETEAEKEEKLAELNRVQQALTTAEKKLKEAEGHEEKITSLEGELDQEQDENERLTARVAELEESIDLSKCEKKSVEAELERSHILLRKFQGSQAKGSEMTPLATPRSKTLIGPVPPAKKMAPALPGSSAKKRKRHGGGHESASQDGKRNKKKNNTYASQNKPPASKPPAAPLKRADGSSVPMQRRGRLARMSNSAQGAASDRSQSTHAAHRSQAALTSTEIFGGLLLGNL